MCRHPPEVLLVGSVVVEVVELSGAVAEVAAPELLVWVDRGIGVAGGAELTERVAGNVMFSVDSLGDAGLMMVKRGLPPFAASSTDACLLVDRIGSQRKLLDILRI